MNGDISRARFDPTRGYSSVQYQQGRVDLEADQNELTEIQLYDARVARRDMIGPTGAPADAPGLSITASAGVLSIGTGRFYVDGIRCDFELAGKSSCPIGEQPFARDVPLPTATGIYMAYLDVWERPITAVQDPAIREVALGGPDTTLRQQVVWQVKLLRLAGATTNSNCDTTFPEWTRLIGGASGTLEVQEAEPGDDAEPCIVPDASGFRGLENQLYRVQIHRGNFDPNAGSGQNGDAPTFKWSRDNGSVVASLLEVSDLNLTIDRLGAGGANGFERGDWVEISHDDDDLAQRGALLAQVDDIRGATLMLKDPDGSVASALAQPDAFRPEAHPQVRRWNSQGAQAVDDDWLELEDGVEVRFGRGSLRAGDYWLVPARTAILPGSENLHLEWPRTSAGDPAALRAQGPRHHYARLALVQLGASGWGVLGTSDCRPVFAPLVDQIHFGARGGDGQHARPSHWLPAPLVVGVSRGLRPMAGARVRFTLDNTTLGALSGAQPDEMGSTSTTVEVTTNSQGLASVWWRLGAAPALAARDDRFQPERAQGVTATLLSHAGTPHHLRTQFTAFPVDNVILKPAGGNGQLGKPGETLEVALRVQVCDGGLPLTDAQVHFQVLDQVFNGSALNELTGGFLHASALRSSGVPWPGGGRDRETVVQTNSDGIAQLQWTLGTDVRLPIQRVQATLLNADSTPSTQQTLFTAELALAQSIVWQPCNHLRPQLDGAVDLQSALNLFCRLFRQRFTDWSALLQEISLVVSTTPPRQRPLEANAPVKLADFAGLALITNFSTPSITAKLWRRALFVEVELHADGGHTTLRLEGDVRAPSGPALDVTWELMPRGRAALLRELQLHQASEIAARLVLVPAYLNLPEFSDPSVRFVRSFWIE